MPVLYSFRRCPYAMRVRLALYFGRQAVELREILLKAKPKEMLDASPKGTVPVLVLDDGTVLDESRDILRWVVHQAASSPPSPRPEHQTYLIALADDDEALLDRCDVEFKGWLDKYKYHVRFPEASREDYRREAEKFLRELNERLQKGRYLSGDSPSLIDTSIMPFIRQFAGADQKWFETCSYTALRAWLLRWQDSRAMASVMTKNPPWKAGDDVMIFPPVPPA